jgi:type IV pilus assembly protein PilA
MEEKSMLAKLRARARNQKGFTLIELLVVVIIIGLLAAIAIPAFLGQRDKANDASAKSLVRNAATAVEAAYADTQDYATITAANVQKIEPNINFVGGGGLASADSVTLAVAATGYTITSKSKSNVTFSYVKNTTATPTVTRTDSAGNKW